MALDGMYSSSLLAADAILSQLPPSATQEDMVAALRTLAVCDDDFFVHSFKVMPCTKTYSHKWTLCPCAHQGETARRRDPRTNPYRAFLCPHVKAKKACPLGDACGYAHNVFEHWLHPSRYKTRLCSFGSNCNRPICFFAHAAEELRCVTNPELQESRDSDEQLMVLQLMMQPDGTFSSPVGGMPGLQQQQPMPPLISLGGGGYLPPPPPLGLHQHRSPLSSTGSGDFRMSQDYRSPLMTMGSGDLGGRPKAPLRTTVTVSRPGPLAGALPPKVGLQLPQPLASLQASEPGLFSPRRHEQPPRPPSADMSGILLNLQQHQHQQQQGGGGNSGGLRSFGSLHGDQGALFNSLMQVDGGVDGLAALECNDYGRSGAAAGGGGAASFGLPLLPDHLHQQNQYLQQQQYLQYQMQKAHHPRCSDTGATYGGVGMAGGGPPRTGSNSSAPSSATALPTGLDGFMPLMTSALAANKRHQQQQHQSQQAQRVQQLQHQLEFYGCSGSSVGSSGSFPLQPASPAFSDVSGMHTPPAAPPPHALSSWTSISSLADSNNLFKFSHELAHTESIDNFDRPSFDGRPSYDGRPSFDRSTGGNSTVSSASHMGAAVAKSGVNQLMMQLQEQGCSKDQLVMCLSQMLAGLLAQPQGV